MTRTEFLLARIADDEQEAAARLGDSTAEGRRHWEHVLADCEAKRRIVAEVQRQNDGLDFQAAYVDRDFFVRILAAVYSDHPDFNEAWQ